MNTRPKKVSEKQALKDQLAQSEYFKNQYVKMVDEATTRLGDYAEAVGLLRQSLDEIIRLTRPYNIGDALAIADTHEKRLLIEINKLAVSVYNHSSIITRKSE